MENKLVLAPERHYEYSIWGYSNLYRKFDYPVYQAHVRLNLSEIPIGITSEMFLGDNYIMDEMYLRNGIGTAGLDIVKELAKHLHCQSIKGNKVPKDDTKEEMDKLTDFYTANGFQQTEGNGILFDMGTYEPILDCSEGSDETDPFA